MSDLIKVLRTALKQWECRKPALCTNAATVGHRVEIDKLVNAITVVLAKLISRQEGKPDDMSERIKDAVIKIVVENIENDGLIYQKIRDKK